MLAEWEVGVSAGLQRKYVFDYVGYTWLKSNPMGRFIVDSGQSWTRMANNRCKMRMLQDTNGPENRSKMTASSVYIE
jgi:hypothetical protein